MKALIQTGSSGRVPVPPEKRFLINFDGLMWGSLLESATIKDKDTIVFKFKDGTEING